MPKILERLVSQRQAKGMDKGRAYATATSTLQKSGVLKKGTQDLTKKGETRQGLGAAGRAKDRAARASGKSPSAYAYNQLTNIARLKKP